MPYITRTTLTAAEFNAQFLNYNYYDLASGSEISSPGDVNYTLKCPTHKNCQVIVVGPNPYNVQYRHYCFGPMTISANLPVFNPVFNPADLPI